MRINKGSVDYDLDKYGRKIRKYTVSKLIKKGKFYIATWVEDTDFRPETEIPKHKVDILVQRW